jgi:hypothetical protein
MRGHSIDSEGTVVAKDRVAFFIVVFANAGHFLLLLSFVAFPNPNLAGAALLSLAQVVSNTQLLEYQSESFNSAW